MEDPKRFYAQLGDSIREAREGQNISQANLARAVGLSRPSITNIELGRQRLHVQQLLSIAQALRVPIIDLVPDAESQRAIPTGLRGAKREFVQEIVAPRRGDR